MRGCPLRDSHETILSCSPSGCKSIHGQVAGAPRNAPLLQAPLIARMAPFRAKGERDVWGNGPVKAPQKRLMDGSLGGGWAELFADFFDKCLGTLAVGGLMLDDFDHDFGFGRVGDKGAALHLFCHLHAFERGRAGGGLGHFGFVGLPVMGRFCFGDIMEEAGVFRATTGTMTTWAGGGGAGEGVCDAAVAAAGAAGFTGHEPGDLPAKDVEG